MNKELLSNPEVAEIALQFARSVVTKNPSWDDFVKENTKEPVKEWEILKVKLDKIYTKYEAGGHYYFQTEQIRSDNDYVKKHIYQVERLSDREIFTVGGTINYGKIKSFELGISMMIVYTDKGLCYDLMEIKAERKPIFITQEGVGVYEGDKFWTASLYMPKSAYYYTALKDQANLTNPLFSFSTEQAANDWVVLNKPSLSLAELVSSGIINQGSPQYDKILKLAKSKI